MPTPDLGAWTVRIQLVWNAKTRKLERRKVMAWRNFPGKPLDFLWIADNELDLRAGKIHGEGRLIWRERHSSAIDVDAVVSVYRGAMADGKPHGWGTYFHRSGAVYEGEWVEGLMQGQGLLFSPFGAEYAGSFVRGRPDGPGRFVDKYGEVYTGAFRNGLRPGEGPLWSAHSRRKSGRWSADYRSRFRWWEC